VGAWVLVHAGFALALIDAGEAARTLALLDELGEQEPGP
jgi:hydrogenase expression/formation protein HypC